MEEETSTEVKAEPQNLNKKTSIHLLSNAMWSQTGYGGQARLLIPRLQALGYDLSMTAYYGLQGHTLAMNNVMIFPVGYHPYGMDVAAGNAALAGAKILMTNVDLWVCEPANFQDRIWIPWFPIDSGNANPMIRQKLPLAFERFCMSKDGTEIVKALGHSCTHIPCGVDTKIFAPGDRVAARVEMNAHIPLKIPADAYLVSMVAMNKGNPSRKAFYAQMRAFKKFKETHPTAALYLHTIKSEFGEQGGVNLVEVCRVLGLEIGKDVFFPDTLSIINGYPDVFLNAVYNASDVLLSVTMGEGFGIPILEAQAAGCPVITGDWTSMPEITFSGWKVKKKDALEVWTMLGAIQYEPNYDAITARLKEAYEARELDSMRTRAREGAMTLDIDKVVEKYWKPALEGICERLKDRPEFTQAPA
jgi:glycosyltransferase involved in cell wall biosynthesis